MKNYLVTFFFILTICFANSLGTTSLHANETTVKKDKSLTQEQAATLASKIANKKFQKDFNMSPFTPESYKAELVDNKWYWGKISPAGINGCSAKVTFNKDGSNENVRVAYSIDTLNKEVLIQKQPMKIDVIKMPESDRKKFEKAFESFKEKHNP